MAVYALGFFGGPPATELLRDRIRDDEDRFVRYNAAVALARRGDPAAEAPSARCSRPPTSTRSSSLTSTTEKQNKIEAIELEALERFAPSIADGQAGARRSRSTRKSPT